MKVGIIICTRTNSERLPNKPFRKINGIPLLIHLTNRLEKTGLEIFLAYPAEQYQEYQAHKYNKSVKFHESMNAADPMARMLECALKHKLDAVIRESHDKILLDHKEITEALDLFKAGAIEYLYSSTITPGCGFEIISTKALKKACAKYKNVEFIGYAVRAITYEAFNYSPRHPRGNYRFLIDYESDLKLFEVLFSQLGNDCTSRDCMKYLDKNPEIKQINLQPMVTVYTCAKNSENYLQDCFDSIERQTIFKNCEYILIDDCSDDSTCEMMAKFAIKHKNVTWSRNEKNIGLASSSNVAVKSARGKYILRLDADDYFVSIHALADMLSAIQEKDYEAVYPNNYFGNLNIIQEGKECHHAGGTIFLKNAINHIKFTDGLRGHDSLDIYLRAKDKLRIGYLQKPMFFYRQHDSSMSKNNLKERTEIKEHLLVNAPLYDDGFDFAKIDGSVSIDE